MEQELGKFLEELRGTLSLRDAAKKSGLSHTYIRDLELGLNRKTNAPIKPTPETLKRLSKAYKYPYEELLKKTGYLSGSEDVDELIAENYSVSSEIKIRFLDLIDTLKEKGIIEEVVMEKILISIDFYENVPGEFKELLKKPYKNKNRIVGYGNVAYLTLIVGTLQFFLNNLENNEEIDLKKLQNKTLKWGDEELSKEEQKKAKEMLKILFGIKKDT
ncbi:helix-turn-helix domain-containing protein [Niallia sp. 03190]|uniref:helix-turn-helix domain-containing protein n=1 Tax=Niallia sp. 03190 TaxID=3458061 RepID=UPI0040441E1A